MEQTILKKIITPSDIWYLDGIGEVPYLTKEIFSNYYFSKSGNKLISTLLHNTIEYNNDDGVINQLGKNIISNIINSKYGKKWIDLYNLYAKEYDFDKPFNITFSEESTDTLTSSESNVSNRTTNDTNVNETKNSNENTDNSRYGFNSSNAVPTDKTTTSYTDKTENTYNSSNVDNRTNTYNRTNPKSRDTSRVGNIGNTTIQELVKQEREKLMYQLWDTICLDLDSVLTRSKYIF